MMKEKAVIGGAVSAGLLASLCCIGPLLFVLFGVGAFGAAATFESARPFLLIASVLLLGIAFYSTYFRRAEGCAPEEVCATKPINKAGRLGLWIASVAVLMFAMVPYFAGPLAARIAEKKPPSEPAHEQTTQEECCASRVPGAGADVLPEAGMSLETFKVEGMTCVSCETTIKLALEQTPGVHGAQVSYDRGEAIVKYDPKLTSHDKVRDAINSTGYTGKEDK